MKKTVKTSLSRNLAASIKGIVPLWSVFGGLCGAMFGLFLSMLMGIELGIIRLATAAVFFMAVFSLHRYIIGGRYPYENLDERSAVREKRKANTELDITKKTAYKASRVKKDKYFLSPGGQAVIGFRINQKSIVNFSTFIQSLFSKLSQSVRIRYLKKTTKTKGQIETELDFLDSEVVIFIEVSNVSLSRDDIIETFWNSLSLYGSPLSLEEIRDYTMEMVTPGRVIHEWEIKEGIFPSPLGLIKKEALLHYGDTEKQAAIFTLAHLAPEIGSNYQKILEVLGSLESTICVVFESLGQTSIIGEALRAKTEELEAYDKHESEQEKVVASKYKMNTKMMTIVIVHGSLDEIKRVEKDLDANYRAIPTSELPFWRREFALFEKALISLLPGSSNYLPERRVHKIIDSEEGYYYFPEPTYKGDDNPVVELKTASGERFGFRLRKKFPLFIWSGVGDGKSVVLGYILKNYILRAREGQKIATFTMETGGSCSFVHDDGLVDLAFILEESGGEYRPLPVPPLRMLLSFGTKGRAQAKEWLVAVCRCEDEMFANLIDDSLFELSENNKYRIKDLYETLEGKVKDTYKPDDPSHYSRKYLSSLRRICALKGALFGKIFDVEENEIDILSAKHYYFTQFPAPKSANDLSSIFFEFAYAAFQCLESSITGDNFHELLLLIDELDNILKMKVLSFSKIRSFNAHGRKEGKDIAMASQELEDIKDESTGESLINSFKEFMCASSADPKVVLNALKLISRNEKNANASSSLAEIEEIISDIRTYRTQKKMYMWALIDHRNKVNLLNFTLPLNKVWQQASESAARELLRRLINRYKLPRSTIIDVLADVGMPVPEERQDIDQKKLALVEKKLDKRIEQ